MTNRMTPLYLAACLALCLSACGNQGSNTGSATSTSTSASSPASAAGGDTPKPDGKTYSGAGLQITNTWVKAVPDLATGTMTGIFGTIKNTSDKEVVIVSGVQDLSNKTELHETVTIDGAMKMREVEKGYTIPAKGSLALKPGGHHVMAMNMTKPLAAGKTVKVTLTTSAGEKLTFEAVSWPFVKGGNEPYVEKTK